MTARGEEKEKKKNTHTRSCKDQVGNIKQKDKEGDRHRIMRFITRQDNDGNK